jgi:DNA primase
VSVTLTWAELARLRTPPRFTIETVPGRLERRSGDPWKDYWTMRQRLPAGSVRALETL